MENPILMEQGQSPASPEATATEAASPSPQQAPQHHGHHGHHGHHHRHKHHVAGADIAADVIPKTCYKKSRWYARRFVDNIFVRLFSILLVLADATIVIIRVVNNGGDLDDKEKSGATYFSNFVVGYFLVELALRIFALGPIVFFRNPWDVFDFCIIVASAILEFAFELASVVILARLVRVAILVRILFEQRHLRRAARLQVGQNKRRYREGGYDLDLCYVTERVIAMSFPSTGKQALYRNPMSEVVRFFNEKHPNHYWIYNLCSERDYNPGKFSNRVSRLKIDDHNVPLLHELVEFCKNVETFMKESPENVISAHCKGGKGRTGTAICSYLLYIGAKANAKESLEYFGMRRTDLRISQQFQGVQTPSQARYVGYIDEIVHKYNRDMPPVANKTIHTIRVYGLLIDPTVKVGAKNLWFQVFSQGKEIFNFNKAQSLGVAAMTMSVGSVNNFTVPILDFDIGSLCVSGDVKIKFHGEGLPKHYDKCPFYFWCHTSFIKDNRLYLTRDELDNPHKKKTWKYFGPHFGVEVFFGDGVGDPDAEAQLGVGTWRSADAWRASGSAQRPESDEEMVSMA